MQKNNVIFVLILIPFLCAQAAFGMNRMDNVQQPQDQVKKPQEPTTLYNYFGIPNLFAAQASKDIRNQLLKAIMQGKEWWYTKCTLGDQSSAAHALSYSSDGAVLAAACKDNAVRLWNQQGKNTITKQYESIVTDVVCHPGEPLLFVALGNPLSCLGGSKKVNTIEKVDFKGATIKAVKHCGMPVFMAIDAQGSRLCTKDYLSSLQTWPLHGGAPTPKKTYPANTVHDVTFYPPENSFVVAVDSVLEVHHPVGVQQINYADVQRMCSIAVQPRGSLCATGYLDQDKHAKIVLRDKGWEVVRTIDCQSDDLEMRALAFDHTGNYIAAAYKDAVVVYAVATGLEVARLWQDGLRKSLAIHPCKHQLAVGCDNAAVQVWEKHQNLTFEQMLLRLVLKAHLARCTLEQTEPSCPNEKQQSTDEGFMQWMGHAFTIRTGNLLAVWRTMPEGLRKSIIRSYVYRVHTIKGLPAVRKQRALDEAERENQRRREQSKFLSYGSFGAHW